MAFYSKYKNQHIAYYSQVFFCIQKYKENKFILKLPLSSRELFFFNLESSEELYRYSKQLKLTLPA